MKKPTNRLFRALAAFLLFPFSIVAGSGIIGPEDPYRGDELDLFDIPETSAVSVTLGRSGPPMSSLSDFCPASLFSQGRQSWGACSESFTPDLSVSVTLRC